MLYLRYLNHTASALLLYATCCLCFGACDDETGSSANPELGGTLTSGTEGTPDMMLNMSARDVSGTMGGDDMAGETGGEIAGAMAGEIAGAMAGEMAGETAGETAGDMAGAEPAGDMAGDELAGEDINTSVPSDRSTTPGPGDDPGWAGVDACELGQVISELQPHWVPSDQVESGQIDEIELIYVSPDGEAMAQLLRLRSHLTRFQRARSPISLCCQASMT